jgi:glycosyltransferase involved in cell wall biosynthesis
MKILFILPYSPIPPTFGGALRVVHLIEQAARRHDVTVIAFGWPEDEERLRTFFRSRLREVRIVLRHWPRKLRRLGQLYSLFTRHSFFHLLANSPVMQEAITKILREERFDVVQVEFSHMGLYTLATDAVKILDAHNVEYENFRRMWEKNRSWLKRIHYRSEYKKFYHEEIDACLNFDTVFVTSDQDKNILDKDVPAIPKLVVPNGVESAYFTPTGEPFEPHSIVFTGAMSYIPNHDGILYFLEEVFPRIERVHADAKVYIVGSNPPKSVSRLARANVIVTGFVEDVRPYVRRSSVYVVPLRMGSGTRLKILEALSMKIPIVSTSIGCEGITVRHDESAMVADSPELFADAVVDLFSNAGRRARLIARGYDLVTTEYTWDIIGKRLDALYHEALASQRKSAEFQSASS